LQKNLDDLNLFYRLKDVVLEKYKQAYPYWKGSLENFGNKEIAQLLELIETETQQRISEKWVYTHLKPTINTKLPRKDMLDILSIWVNYSGWDEFTAKNQTIEPTVNLKIVKLTAIVTIIVVGIFLISNLLITKNHSICFYDQYTQKIVSTNSLMIYTIEKEKDTTLQLVNDGCIQVKNGGAPIHLKIASPYYKDITLNHTIDNKENSIIYLQPDDYAMMLRAYMNSDVKDWKRRRLQLSAIILDEAEIIEIMNEDIGVEFLNKEEFIDKITIPLESTKRMEIVDIQYNDNNQIVSLKFIQKNKNE